MILNYLVKDEADQSLEKFEAIRRRWISSQSREIPQDLRDALNDQVKACDNLLSGKNMLLDDLNRELKGWSFIRTILSLNDRDIMISILGSEDEYVKTLKKQYDDLEIVSQRMEEQYKTMDQAYREEIKQIVKALDNQFDARIFDWERKAKELSEKEENFLEVKTYYTALSVSKFDNRDCR